MVKITSSLFLFISKYLIDRKGRIMGKDLKGKELGTGLRQRKDSRYCEEQR